MDIKIEELLEQYKKYYEEQELNVNEWQQQVKIYKDDINILSRLFWGKGKRQELMWFILDLEERLGIPENKRFNVIPDEEKETESPEKWYEIIDDSINVDEMSVLIYVEGRSNPYNFEMLEDENGFYVYLYGKKFYILEPTQI